MGVAGKDRYDTVAVLIHWVTAVVMIIMIFVGEDLMEAGEEAEHGGSFLSGTLGPSIHVSLGASVLILTLIRILWRLTHTPPPYPATMKGWEVGLSRLVHGVFYLLMIAIPVTGWLAFSGFLAEEPLMAGVRVFGAFPVPAAPAIGKTAKELHEIGSNAAMLLLGLHVLAALKHQFIDRDGLLARMRPH